MSEIRTCEQYVLRDLENTQKELENVNLQLNIANEKIAKLSRVIELLEPKLAKNYKEDLEIVVENICSHSNHLDELEIYSWYKPEVEKYNELVELLGLTYEEEGE